MSFIDRNNPTTIFIDKCDHRYLFKDSSQVTQLQASTTSNNIECKYYLVASVDFNGVLCCSQAPTVKIPIIIYIPDIRYNDDTFRPNNWNPQVMPTFDFNISSSNFNNNSQPMMTGGSQPMMTDGSQPMMTGGSQPFNNY